MKYRHTEEEYQLAAAESRSLAEMCRKLGILARGGNFGTLKAKIAKYDIDTSHFLGQGWNRENYSASPVNKTSIKKKLIRERGHQCQRCLLVEWLDEPITLELEHVDGDNQNNVESNLLLLCPNCHSLTPTWKNKNRKTDACECGKSKLTRQRYCDECREIARLARRGRENAKRRAAGIQLRGSRPARLKSVQLNFCTCGKQINDGSKQCPQCYAKQQERIRWPEVEALGAMVAASSFSAVARGLGVSDNAVRKRLRNHAS